MSHRRFWLSVLSILSRLCFPVAALLIAAALHGCGGQGERWAACAHDGESCSCSADESAGLVDDGNTCKAASFATGACCEDATGCSCRAFACASPAHLPSFCSCGAADVVADDADDVPRAACAPAAADHHCCQYAVYGAAGGLCICSSLECSGTEVEVASCTAETTAVCGESHDAVPTCR